MNEPHGRSDRRALAWCGAAALVLGVVYLWVISAGNWRPSKWPQYLHYYGLLAEGFSRGHTYYPIRVPDWVLRLPNPYDPTANTKFNESQAHDMALYQGRLYSAWGPVPAFLAWGMAIVSRRKPAEIGDPLLVFAFVLGLMMTMGGFLLMLRQREFPACPPWAVGACLLACGMAAPLTFLLARPSVYEVAIAGGQFFLILGFLCAYVGVEKHTVQWMLGAGICWALCLGCRVSLICGIALGGAIMIWQLRREPGRVRLSEKAALALCLPVAAGVIGLFCYNYVRFGSPTEFGVQYQLAYVDQHINPGLLFGIKNVPINVLTYLFLGPAVERHFPFIDAGTAQTWSNHFFPMPYFFHFEPVAGIAWSIPFLWYMIAAARGGKQPMDRWRGLCVALAAAGVGGFFPTLLMPGSTMRYLNDAAPASLLVAAMGFFDVMSRPGRWKGGVAVAIVALTAAIGLLLTIRGFENHLATFNPELWKRLHAIGWGA